MATVTIVDRSGTAPRVGYLGGFWALMVTQFQGAFNDNALKVLITLFLPVLFPPESRMQGYITAVTGALFTLPWIFLAGQAGALSDRFSKRSVTIWTKYWEMAVMLLVVFAFYLRSPYAIWFLWLLMATQSAFFSPAKYGILPEMLPEGRLSWGNGYLQMTTQVAIVSGMVLAGLLLDSPAIGIPVHLALMPLFLLSVVGVVAAHFVTPVPPANPDQRIPINPWTGMGRYFRYYATDRWLLLSLLGMVYFWFVGSFLLLNVIEFAKAEYGLASYLSQTSLLAFLAVGIGVGGVLAGYLSGGKIEGGLVPLGAFGMTVFLTLLGFLDSGYWTSGVLLFALGASSGFYEIPLAAAIQQRSPDDSKGGMLAAMNLATFLGIIVSSVLFGVLYGTLGLSPRSIFLFCGIMTLIVGVVSVYFVPMYLVRLFLWAVTHSIYRLHVYGLVKFVV
jgi:acyl-[acyl-carrier-protein]-phospholipid O-acyltransferase/long-chain-fatty-acid--[acyl-carrier-protein] ligase